MKKLRKKMKELWIALGVLYLMVVVALVTYEITTAKIIRAIEVDSVNEVDNGIITLKINGKFYDYEYEFDENFKTLQERINNGENVSEWVKIIK